MLVFGAFIAGILSAFFGGKAFATAGNTAEISSGTWEICVNATLDTQSPDFSLDITKSGFESQLVLGGGECKTVKLTGSSAYTVSLGSTMGASSVNYEVSEGSLTFNVANSLSNYLNAFGSVTYTTEGSGEESDFELLFSMPGTCYLNGNANVSGDTCKDGDGNPLTDKKYIDTGVALFSEGNAARDFEIYFTLDDYASTQPNNQGTLFNAKYENSSMLYPGFTLRMSGSNVQTMELTGRIGNDNTNADKAKKDISTASLKGKEMKIVRVGGLVSYSIDGGELIEFQNYQNFSRYFEQSAVFGASLQTNGTPQRYYDGTVSNIRIYLKKVGNIEFNANGGTGTMSAIENAQLGASVTLPANTFTREGHEFAGWNTAADGTGNDYADEAEVTITSADTLMLYAQWVEKPKGRIEFEANGGTGTMATIEDIIVGTSVTLPANEFERTNYSFEGWNTAADGTGTDYVDEADVTISSTDTLTLYAQWEELKGSITFDANGGTGTMAAIENITLGTSVTLPANTFTKKNANFDGWNTAADGTGVSYVDNATITITEGREIELFAQWDEIIIVTTLQAGPQVNNQLRTLAKGSSLVSYYEADTKIKDLSFVDTLPGTVDENTPKANIALSNEIPVYAYWVAGDETMYIYTEATKIYANQNSSNLFSYLQALTSLILPNILDTSNVTDMSGMFSNMSALTSLSLSDKFDTSNVTNMGSMFASAKALTSLAFLDKFNTSNVTNMYSMFIGMFSLTSLTLPSNFDTSNVTDMRYMFCNMQALTSLTLPNSFNTSNVTNMSQMFGDLKALTSLVLPESFDTSSVTDMRVMFVDMPALTSLTLPASFNTSNVTSMYRMFDGVSSLTSLTLPASFNTQNVTDMYGMFSGMRALTSLTLPASFNTSNVTRMTEMFYRMTSLTSLTLPASFNTQNVTDMNSMFSTMTSLTSLTLPASFNTQNVTNMGSMFAYTSSLTSLTLPASFDTSSVTSMGSMFSGMKALTSLTLPEGSFNTSNVTSMNNMFSDVSSLASLTLPNSFDTSSVTSMGSMFYGMSSLTSITFPASFNTQNVTSMYGMFCGTTSLTSLTLPASFSTRNVTNMGSMFAGRSTAVKTLTLTLPDSFVISSDTTTSYMFQYIRNTSTLYATDATARSLWPGVLGN